MPNCCRCDKSINTTNQVKSLLARLNLDELKYCYECARQIRLSFWPFSNFYPYKDDLTGEDIITTFPPQTKFPIYKRSNWHSDKWQPPELQYDPIKSFFQQLEDLQFQTPHFHALGDAESVNCDYCDDVWNSKDCYLNRSFAGNQNTHYSYRNIDAKDCIDVTFCFRLNNCYDCTYCFDSYNLKHSINSRNCMDSSFLYDCRNCENCYMCWNLRHKKYYIKNKQYSPEEYYNIIEGEKPASHLQKNKNQFKQILKTNAYHKQDLNNKVENCTGNFIDRGNNAHESNLASDLDNCYDVFRGVEDKDSLGISGLLRGELSYMVVQSTDIYNSKFVLYSVNCKDCEYIDQCYDCDYCFGCVGLKKKKYCILNKQYSKKQYFELIEKIKQKMQEDEEYGKYFPQAMAYNGYNYSLANFYYPLNQEEIEKFNSFWEEPSTSHTRVDPNKHIYKCKKTNRIFKLVPQELDFYKKNNIPFPEVHYDRRNIDRYQFMTAVIPQSGVCSECNKKITHYYPPEWGYKKIICNQCYNKIIY